MTNPILDQKSKEVIRDFIGDLVKADRQEEALVHCIRWVNKYPKDPTSWHYLGMTLYFARRHEESIQAYQRSIDLKSEFTRISHFNLSQIYLTIGNYKKGLELFEARISSDLPIPLELFWKGEDIAGKTLVVTTVDGGLGDTLMFLRYIPYLARTQCNLFLDLQPELHDLFQHLEVPILATGARIHYDRIVTLGSLPNCFRTELLSIPPPVTINCCLKPIPGRIGIVWKASVRTLNDPSLRMGKDIDLQQLAPLLNLPNQYVCVQKNVTQEDAQLLDYYGVERPPLRTFADTVRILETCERVVCVDTSVTHLAASMGIPTWVLLPYNACWRWLIYRPDSPWYPSIRLFRQNTRNQWDDPIQDIVNNLPA